MDVSWPSKKLLHGLSEENYDHTFSAYRLSIELGAVHGGVSNHQLRNDILSDASTRPSLITIPWWEYDNNTPHSTARSYGTTQRMAQSYNNTQRTAKGQLIHSNVHLLLQFITDAEIDPILSTYAVGLHNRLCRESLKLFFRQTLDYIPGEWEEPTSEQLCEFYTRVNLIAHWVNLGYVKLEDVRDRILQFLAFQPTVHVHQLNSLMILLKISGATFAAYVDPSVMDRCRDLLQPSNLSDKFVLTELAEVSALILMIKISYDC